MQRLGLGAEPELPHPSLAQGRHWHAHPAHMLLLLLAFAATEVLAGTCDEGEKWKYGYWLDSCIDCASGKYMDAKAHQHKECKACVSAGKACATGKYKTGYVCTKKATAAGACKTCPAGRYGMEQADVTDTTYLNALTKDGSTDYCDAGGMCCATCKLVKYNGNLCTAGTYAGGCGVGGSKGACTGCGAGKYKYKVSNLQSDCILCSTGRYSGASTASSAAQCIECPVGRANGVKGQSVCAGCAAGKYQDAKEKNYCIGCPVGRANENLASSSSSACTACSSGKFSSGSQGTCTSCAAGTFAGKESKSCTSCAAGAYSADGAASCSACTKGRYSPTIGRVSAAQCIACPFGKFGPTAGAPSLASCSGKCAAGSFSDMAGLSSAGQCRECSKGRYSAALGLTSLFDCTQCPAGKFGAKTKAQTVSQCSDCGAGRFSTRLAITSLLDCTKCAAGKYIATTGALSCKPCQIGTYGSQLGMQTCSKCAAGRYSGAVGRTAAAQCIGCPSGKFGNLTAATKLADCSGLCPSGKYGAKVGKTSASECSLCPIGFFNKAAGSTSSDACSVDSCRPGSFGRIAGASSQAQCSNCTAGRYGLIAAASVASQCKGVCAAGKFSALSGLSIGTQCTNCSSGRFSATTAASSAGQCSGKCPAGTYGSVTGAVTAAWCLACPAGTFGATPGLASASQCSKCARGKYSSASGLSTGSQCASACPKGRYSDVAGLASASQCKTCAAGRAGAELGASSVAQCEACPGGKYQSKLGSAACVECTAGRYNAKTGSVLQSACIGCAAGRFSGLGTNVCAACAAGRFAGVDASVCAPCPAGTAMPSNGSSSCASCGAGRYNSKTAQVACYACPAGRWADQPGRRTKSSECKACQKGLYSNQLGVTACSYCPIGRYQDSEGQTICKLCSAGKVQASDGAKDRDAHKLDDPSDCALCDVDEYQDKAGKGQCTACNPPYSRTRCSFCPQLPTRCVKPKLRIDVSSMSAVTFTTSYEEKQLLICNNGEGPDLIVSAVSAAVWALPFFGTSKTKTKTAIPLRGFNRGCDRLNIQFIGSFFKKDGQHKSNLTLTTNDLSQNKTGVPGLVVIELLITVREADLFVITQCALCSVVGTPTSVATRDFKIRNVFTSKIKWSIDCASMKNKSGWLTLSPCSGTLALGTSAKVKFVTRLPTVAGSYSANVVVNGSVGTIGSGVWNQAIAVTVKAAALQPNVTTISTNRTVTAGSFFTVLIEPRDKFGNLVSDPNLVFRATLGGIVFISQYASTTSHAIKCKVSSTGKFNMTVVHVASGTAKTAVATIPVLAKSVVCVGQEEPNKAGSACLCRPGFEQLGLYCSRCAYGKFRTRALQSCESCAAGKQPKSTVGATECTKCPAGRVHASGKVAMCVACGGGAQPNADSSFCQACAVVSDIQFSSDGKACINCAAGKIPSTKRTSCALCPSGRMSGAKNTSSSSGTCGKCPANKESLANRTACRSCSSAQFLGSAAVCEKCVPNSVRLGKKQTCECLPGYTLLGGQCKLCAVAKIKTQTSNAACTSCAGNKEADKARTKCVKCKDNSLYVKAGVCTAVKQYSRATSQGDDYECLAGYMKDGSGNCLRCLAGTAKALAGNGVCAKCGPAQESNAKRTGCSSCATTQYALSNLCTRLPSFSEATAKGNSYQCLAGYTKSGSGDCVQCSTGYAKAASGNGACIPCKAWEETNAKRVACNNCSSARYALNRVCVQLPSFSQSTSVGNSYECLAGYTKDGTGNCLRCNPGSYKATAGNRACITCEKWEESLANRTGCTNCSAVRYSLNNMCTKLPAFSRAIALGNDYECLAGFAKDGSGNCIRCLAGSAKSSAGNGACTKCQPAQEPNAKRTGCRNCSASRYSLSNVCTKTPGHSQPTSTGDDYECKAGYTKDGTGNCNLCAIGKAKANVGNFKCSGCNVSAEAFANRSACVECNRATHYALSNICTKLPQNSQAKTTGDDYECKVGFTKDGVGDCVLCSVGKAKATAGNGKCNDCAVNQEADAARAVCVGCNSTLQYARGFICTALPVFSVATLGGDSYACRQGYFFDSGSEQCAKCDLGQYKSAVDRSLCQRCASGAEALFDRSGCRACNSSTEYKDDSAKICAKLPPGSRAGTPTAAIFQFTAKGSISRAQFLSQVRKKSPGATILAFSQVLASNISVKAARSDFQSTVQRKNFAAALAKACNATTSELVVQWARMSGRRRLRATATSVSIPFAVTTSAAPADLASWSSGVEASLNAHGITVKSVSSPAVATKVVLQVSATSDQAVAAASAALATDALTKSLSLQLTRTAETVRNSGFACGPGTFKATDGKGCSRCAKGTYNVDGLQCLPCQPSQNANDARTACVCKLNTFDWRRTGGKLSCYEGDYVPQGENVTDSECTLCPACMDCTELGAPTLKAGYKVLGKQPIVGRVAFSCPLNDEGASPCLAHSINATETPCADGHRGLLCSKCVAGWRRAGNMLCTECTGNSTVTAGLYLGLIIIFALPLLIVIVYSLRAEASLARSVIFQFEESSLREIFGERVEGSPRAPLTQKELFVAFEKSNFELTQSELGKIFSAIDANGDGIVSAEEFLTWVKQKGRRRSSSMKADIKIVIGMFQVVSQLGTVLDVPYPEWMQKMGLVTFDLFVVFPCLDFGNYYLTFLFSTIGVPAILATIPTVMFLYDRSHSDGKQRKIKDAKLDLKGNLFFVGFLCYPKISQTAIQHFYCRDLASTTVLAQDYDVECWSSAHLAFCVMSVMLLVFFSIGAPFRLAWAMAKFRRRIAAAEARGDTASKYSKKGFERRFDFASEDYKPEMYYSECVDLLRKLTLAGLVIFLGRGTVGQLFITLLICFGFLMWHMFHWPYKETSNNVMKMAAESQVFFVLLVGLIMKFDPKTLQGEALSRDWYNNSLIVVILLGSLALLGGLTIAPFVLRKLGLRAGSYGDDVPGKAKQFKDKRKKVGGFGDTAESSDGPASRREFANPMSSTFAEVEMSAIGYDGELSSSDEDDDGRARASPVYDAVSSPSPRANVL